MRKFMENRRNKKGFTLAEMLIVVAIIAILVAIAIPLFKTSLDKAHRAVEQANKRSVRSAAIIEIMDQWDSSEYAMRYSGGTSGTAADYWQVEARIDGNGKITIERITAFSGTPTMANELYETTGKSSADSEKNIHIITFVQASDLSASLTH